MSEDSMTAAGESINLQVAVRVTQLDQARHKFTQLQPCHERFRQRPELMCVGTRVALCLVVMFCGWDGNLYLNLLPSIHPQCTYLATVPDAGLFHGSCSKWHYFLILDDFGWFCHILPTLTSSSSAHISSSFSPAWLWWHSLQHRPLLKFVVPAQAGIYEYKPLPLEAAVDCLWYHICCFPLGSFSQSWASWSARAVGTWKAESAPTNPSAQFI